MRIREYDPLFRQGINSWRPGLWMTAQRTYPVIENIDYDEDDVWPGGLRQRRCRVRQNTGKDKQA